VLSLRRAWNAEKRQKNLLSPHCRELGKVRTKTHLSANAVSQELTIGCCVLAEMAKPE
jgi:hypothetical protein